MIKKFHISISVGDFDASIKEYNERLGKQADVVVGNRYALWRTDEVNFSISKKDGEAVGTMRHIGFEDESVQTFSENKDCNGIVWERFNASAQRAEIKDKFGV